MQEQNQRLSKIAREFNVGVDTILEFLLAQGIENLNRNSKVSNEIYGKLVDEFQPDKKVKAEAKELKRTVAKEEQEIKATEVETVKATTVKLDGFKVVDKVDLSPKPKVKQVEVKKEPEIKEVVEKEEVEKKIASVELEIKEEEQKSAQG